MLDTFLVTMVMNEIKRLTSSIVKIFVQFEITGGISEGFDFIGCNTRNVSGRRLKSVGDDGYFCGLEKGFTIYV